jgi:hypothetical protein
MMLLSSVHVDFWYISGRRRAFVVGNSGERDLGVKWEKTSVRPSMSTLLDLLTQAIFVTVEYGKSANRLLNPMFVNYF